MQRQDLLALLEAGDRRTIGRSDEVVAMVVRDPKLFPKLITGLCSDNPLVGIRAADATEKVTRAHPDLLRPYKKELLGLMTEATEQELRWHLALMVPRLPLNAREGNFAATVLVGYLQDRSSIVKTCALQGLADLAQDNRTSRPRVTEILRKSTRDGTPAMKARSRILLKKLERD